jgi:hypothetical protein
VSKAGAGGKDEACTGTGLREPRARQKAVLSPGVAAIAEARIFCIATQANTCGLAVGCKHCPRPTRAETGDA